MDVLIYGAGRLGRQVQHYIERHFADTYRLCGFVDDHRLVGDVVAGQQRIKGSLDDVTQHEDTAPIRMQLVFAIGYADMPGRQVALHRALAAGYTLAPVVHPRAHVEPGVSLKAGVIIGPGAVIDQRSSIGSGTFLDSATTVCEDCRIGSNNFIAAGTTIGGQVTVGESNFIGLNSTIVDGVTLGNHNFINAQSLVHRNHGDHCKVVEFHEQRILQGVSS